MKQTTNLTEVQDILQQSSVVVVYLSMPNCSVCHAVRPRLEELLTNIMIFRHFIWMHLKHQK